jgi:hypothetical protein
MYTGTHCEKFNSQCDKHEDCANCIYRAYESYKILNNPDNIILPSDCVSSCVSSKKEGEEDIYIEGIEYDKENKIARIIPDQSADQGELIKGKGRVTQWVDKIDKSFPKKCNGQDEKSCRIKFGFLKRKNDEKLSLVVEKEIHCPEPPNPWVVAGSILGGVVFLGLVILALIKIIIYVISRREVKEWEKERKHTAITSVS